jgi:hypothetical protein
MRTVRMITVRMMRTANLTDDHVQKSTGLETLARRYVNPYQIYGDLVSCAERAETTEPLCSHDA